MMKCMILFLSMRALTLKTLRSPCAAPAMNSLNFGKNIKYHLERSVQIVHIERLDQVPSAGSIQTIPREQILKLVFTESLDKQREVIGSKLAKELEGFQVNVHWRELEINISKLITDEEIEQHQVFFEQCAKDYRILAQRLIYQLAEKLGIQFDEVFPLLTFNPLKRDNSKCRGRLGKWFYYLHGFDCGFENTKTGQSIEVTLVHGLEFGALDPYFFTRFIKSTPEYEPLPVAIYEDYADGKRILEKMIALGRFELINSNIAQKHSAVVTDRVKVNVNVFEPEPIKTDVKKKSFWNFFKSKK